MSTHLRPGGSLGVGWGETVSRVIAATSFGAVGPVRMVTLTGGVDGYLPAILSSTGEVAAEADDLVSASVIPSPIMASTPALAAALREEPTIQQVLKQACEVEHALVGVGTPTADATIVHIGYLNADDARGLREQDVVGDVLGQFFDANGDVVDLPIHDRRIGIDLSDLARIPKVVGVAGGLRRPGHSRRAARRLLDVPRHRRAGRDPAARLERASLAPERPERVGAGTEQVGRGPQRPWRRSSARAPSSMAGVIDARAQRCRP